MADSKNLTQKDKSSLYKDISLGMSSSDIRKKYGLSVAQLSYYSKQLKLSEKHESQTSVTDNPKPMKKAEGTLYTEDLSESVDKLIKRLKREFRENPVGAKASPQQANVQAEISKGEGKDVTNEMITLVPADSSVNTTEMAENGKFADSSLQSKKFVTVIIDGIEILIKPDTKKIVVESDRVYIFRH